ncbi:hypothetical protein EBR96_01545 [bacterium]|nr:hypothetical protein [bacterium]
MGVGLNRNLGFNSNPIGKAASAQGGGPGGRNFYMRATPTGVAEENGSTGAHGGNYDARYSYDPRQIKFVDPNELIAAQSGAAADHKVKETTKSDSKSDESTEFQQFEKELGMDWLNDHENLGDALQKAMADHRTNNASGFDPHISDWPNVLEPNSI